MCAIDSLTALVSVPVWFSFLSVLILQQIYNTRYWACVVGERVILLLPHGNDVIF